MADTTTTPEIVVIAGRLYEKKDYFLADNSAKTSTVIRKREMYGAGDIKADQVMREEIERVAASEGDSNGD